MARLSATDRSEWERRGGRVRVDAKGRPVYVIRRQIGGRRYEVSTRRHSLSAALAELERFERDPERYAVGPTADTAAVYLDNELTKGFLAWSLGEKHNSALWVTRQKAVLAWWMERLRGVNLRRASLRDHILPALEKAPSRGQRIAILKALFSWLRKERHVITSAEDPTLDLTVPQQEPAQWRKSKVIPREHLDLVLEHLGPGPWRDVLTLQAGTGWHVTEAGRFASTGSVEPLPRQALQEGVAGVLVCPQHKSGEPLRTRASAPVVEAARRLLEHGAFSREWYHRAVKSACKVAGIPVFTPGRLRHSVATWAIDSGADPASVAAFLGHKSPRTTRRFYAVHASPTKVPTLL